MNRTMAHDETQARDVRGRMLSVILPVYNERAVLTTLVAQVTAAAEATGLAHEIVFVNDGSSDGSAELLDRLAAGDARVRVLHLSRNFGHQAAVQAGLAHARGDAIVLMDSDLQDAPSAIGRFVDQWRQGYDVVYAVRTARKEGRIKRLLFAAFYRLLSAVSNTRIPLDAGNFGLVDARVARQVAALPERDRYYAGLRSWVGFRQIGVVVERGSRYDDRPRVSMWGLFRLAKTAIFSFSTTPLALFTVIGLAASTIFVGLAGFSLFCKLFTNLAIPGWTSHILSASFFGALNALGISVLGEYVVRIYDQVRARPIYLVGRAVNFDVAPAAQVGRRRRRIDGDADRGRPVGRGHAGRDAEAPVRVDRGRVGGPVVVGAALAVFRGGLAQRREPQRLRPRRHERKTELSPAVRDHEVDQLGCHALGRTHEVALVLARLIVGHDHEPPPADVFDRLLYRSERHSAFTYFATMSPST